MTDVDRMLAEATKLGDDERMVRCQFCRGLVGVERCGRQCPEVRALMHGVSPAPHDEAGIQMAERPS